jgi:hypothetical protein
VIFRLFQIIFSHPLRLGVFARDFIFSSSVGWQILKNFPLKNSLKNLCASERSARGKNILLFLELSTSQYRFNDPIEVTIGHGGP